MITQTSVRQYGAVVVLFSIWVLMIGLLPTASPAIANQPVSQPLDTTMEDFAGGIFERTTISATGDGAVELMRAGRLRRWGDVPFNLPESLAEQGVVALGGRLYVIGGSTNPGSASVSGSSKVYWTNIDPAQGRPPVDADPLWNEIELPTLPTSDPPCDAPIAAVTRIAVAAVKDDGPRGTSNTGTLYVIGGRVAPTPCPIPTLSSNVVHIGRVNAEGTISWSEGPKLPNGLESATATSITINNRTFIYVFGGLEYRISPITGGLQIIESRTVYYAEVNKANGSLGNWNTGPDIPLIGDVPGLWNATAVPVVAQNGNSAIYLLGGQTRLSVQGGQAEYNPRVFRAMISSNGALTWDTEPGRLQSGGTSPVSFGPRIGFSGVVHAGKLYLIGGAASETANGESAVFTAIVNDDLTLQNFGTDTLPQFFVESSNILPFWRTFHASAFVPALPTPEDPAAVYIFTIAGTGPNPAGIVGVRNTIFRGRVGGAGDTEEDGNVVEQGWYYSRFHTTRLSDARIKQFIWNTEQTDDQDVRLEYRVTKSICSADNPFGNAEWKALDGVPADADKFSKTGLNNHVFEDRGEDEPEANCVQYRALLRRGANINLSPALLDVGIDVIASGSPDLKVHTLQALRGENERTFIGLNIAIINQNDVENTTEVPPGSFYVDLCVIEPGETTIPPQLSVFPLNLDPPLPCVRSYAMVNSNQVGIDRPYQINQRWYDPHNNNALLSSMQDMEKFFQKVGVYTVYLAVDSLNNIAETSTGGEENNVSDPLEVVIYPADDPVWNPTMTPPPDATPDVDIPPAIATPTPTLPANPTVTPSPTPTSEGPPTVYLPIIRR